ncbi:MAG: DUF4870 domain-containing protein [Candidatus Coatesbacteria bacterium]|nr:MAG: DUF4870 domain-containing protein [Candidatus Coatesbacteria bacterium]
MPKSDSSEIEEGKTFAAIGYLGLLFLIPLLAARDNKFAQFHAKQGMMLCIVGIIAFVVIAILSVVLWFIPCIGWLIEIILWLALFVGWLVLAIMGLVKAFQGEYWKMPVLGGWAEQLNF